MDLLVSIFKVLSPQASCAELASEVMEVFQGRQRHSSLLRHRSRKMHFLIKVNQKPDRFKEKKEALLEGRP